jgi:phosphatidylglycerol phospholipase C
MLRRAHIGMNPRIAKEYFWESCESFSIDFSSLSSAEVSRLEWYVA